MNKKDKIVWPGEQKKLSLYVLTQWHMIHSF